MDRRSNTTASAPRSFASAAVKKIRQIAQAASQASTEVEPFLITLGPLLSNVEGRLDHLSQPESSKSPDDDKNVLKLLTDLERLIRWPEALHRTPRSPFNRANYPHLEQLLNTSHQTARSNLRRQNNLSTLARSTNERDVAKRKKLLKSFREFANTQISPLGPPLSDLITVRTQPVGYHEHAVRLRLLHAVLNHCSRQADRCGGGFTANVALTSEHDLETTDDDIPFDFFFLHRHPGSVGDRWKEARISVFLRDEFQSPKAKRISPEDFCDLVRRREHGRLILNAAQDGLVYERVELKVEQLKRLLLLKASSVSLATVLEKRKLHGDLQLKILLSYLLAKAVWQFYDSEWMTSSWSKRSIHFMRERLNDSTRSQEVLILTHKPYFATELASKPTSSTSGPLGESSGQQDFTHRFPSATHIHPKILALGIMLLEIELGEGIESHRQDESDDDQDSPIENEDHYTAGKIILSPMWQERGVYWAIKEMIEICLKPDTEKFDSEESLARESLYTYVVAPLGKLFKQAWPHDRDPDSFCPNPVSFQSTEFLHESVEPLHAEVSVPDDQSPVQGPALRPKPSKTAVTSLSDTIDTVRGTSGAATEKSDYENTQQLSSDYGEKRPKTPQENTDNWFKTFQLLLVKYHLLGRGSDQRIKVAILDSGIDFNHPDLTDEDRDRIKTRVTFVGGDADVDETGHGTQVAAIILRLTKNIDLYIGKITNTRIVTQREEIAKALNVARTQWGVHMINLSFGFESVRSPDTMGDEIRQCLHDGIMVFASASNDGGGGSRSYPAKYPGVVCAHSSTWLGNKADRNPGPEEDRNFSFVGELVRPVWRVSTPNNDKQMKYASGTSYATPVAVSIAALMIGYIRRNLKGYAWVIKPWSPEGIMIIFKMMAVNRDGYDWVSPQRYLDVTKEGKILGDLQQYLG